MDTNVLKTFFVVYLLVTAVLVGLIGFDDNLAVEASAEVLYVYPGGESTGNYSRIQDAIDNASKGDTIRVFNGWYFENVIVNKSVSLVGNTSLGSSNMSIIYANGVGDCIYVDADNVTIMGFILYGSGKGINDSGIELNNVTNCTIKSNVFINNSIGIWLNNTMNTTITGNYFDENNVSFGAESSTKDRIVSNYINNSFDFDVFVVAGSLKVVNCSVNSSKLGTIGSSKIIVQEYFYVVAISAFGFGEGPGVADVMVQVFENGTGLKVFEGYTNSEGFLFPVPLTVYIYEGFLNYSMQNMTFKASKKGYTNGTNITNASIENRIIFITLGDDSVPIVYNFEMNPLENISYNNPCEVQATVNESGDAMIMFVALKYIGENQTLEFYTDMAMFREDLNVSKRSENIYDVNFTWYANSPPIVDEGMGGYLYDSVNKTYLYCDLRDDNGRNITNISIYFMNSTYSIMEAGLEYWTENLTVRGLYIEGPEVWVEASQFAQADATIQSRVERISFIKGTDELAGPPAGEYQPIGPLYNLTEVKFRGEEPIPDGEYKVGVVAVDYGWNIGFNMTNVTVDNTQPKIKLFMPESGSVVVAGTVIDIDVSDMNLKNITYKVGSGPELELVAPFDISTLGWADDVYTITVYANDSANNSADRIYTFTIDSTKPGIALNSPSDNAIIVSGTTIDLAISDANIDFVNYTINGASNTTIDPPYEIYTSTWPDGDCVIDVYATDLAGNTNMSQYTFTIDSTQPLITLVSPANDSFVLPGTNISLTILDANLDSVNYSMDGGAAQPLSEPYNITTVGWDNGIHTVGVQTKDLAGNTNQTIFSFTFDGTEPVITLNTPANKSVIKAGSIIDFDITETNPESIRYSVNGGGDNALIAPYNIDTTGWLDGNYEVIISVRDQVGLTSGKMFMFTIDSTEPEILLIAPMDKSVVKAGINLTFGIMDDNLKNVNYTNNGLFIDDLIEPYNISTELWSDGMYEITISALDKAGNSASAIFTFTIDSTKPTITLTSPTTTEVTKGTIIDLNITDANLESVNYTLDGGEAQTLAEPFDIATASWAVCEHELHVSAIDKAGNSETKTFTFTIKTIIVEILKVVMVTPAANTIDVVLDTKIEIEFNLSMDTASVENAISISPTIDITSYKWNNENTKVTLTLSSKLMGNTKYTLTIGIGAKTESGIALSEAYSWSFTTELDTDGDNIPDSEDDDDDDDGMLDTWELTHGLDPTDPADALEDLDDDGLTNLDEHQYQTLPNVADTDNDGLLDGAEISLYNTNPLLDDTDGDGYKDGVEIEAGTDPNNKASNPGEPDEEEEKDEVEGLFGLGKVGGIDVALILFIIIIIIIILLAALVMRKKPEEREEEEEEEEFECPECGAIMMKGDFICSECGAELEEETTEAEEPEDEELGEEELEDKELEDKELGEEELEDEELEDEELDEEELTEEEPKEEEPEEDLEE